MDWIAQYRTLRVIIIIIICIRLTRSGPSVYVHIDQVLEFLVTTDCGRTRIKYLPTV